MLKDDRRVWYRRKASPTGDPVSRSHQSCKGVVAEHARERTGCVCYLMGMALQS